MMINLTDTSANFDLFSKVLFVVDYNEEDICRRAAEAAAAEDVVVVVEDGGFSGEVFLIGLVVHDIALRVRHRLVDGR